MQLCFSSGSLNVPSSVLASPQTFRCWLCCLTSGDGGAGDGSSGSEESGNDGGVSTIPLPSTNVQTTYDVLRGLGIVGSSATAEDEDSDACNLRGHGRNSLYRLTEVGMKHSVAIDCCFFVYTDLVVIVCQSSCVCFFLIQIFTVVPQKLRTTVLFT